MARAKKYKPVELFFDIKKRRLAYNGNKKVVAVILYGQNEDADDLNFDNVIGLPIYFSSWQAYDCCWEFPDQSVEDIKADLNNRGFTYQKTRAW